MAAQQPAHSVFAIITVHDYHQYTTHRYVHSQHKHVRSQPTTPQPVVDQYIEAGGESQRPYQSLQPL